MRAHVDACVGSQLALGWHGLNECAPEKILAHDGENRDENHHQHALGSGRPCDFDEVADLRRVPVMWAQTRRRAGAYRHKCSIVASYM